MKLDCQRKDHKEWAGWFPHLPGHHLQQHVGRGVEVVQEDFVGVPLAWSQHYATVQYSYAATESEDVDPPPELVSLLRHGVDPGAPHGVQPGAE